MRAVYGPPMPLTATRPRWLVVGVPVGGQLPRVLAHVAGPLPCAQASAAGFLARGFTRVDVRAEGLS